MPRASDTPSERLARTETWAGVSAGDRVDVLDERERGARFWFVAHVTNCATADSLVEVVGGRGIERRRRSFRPEQLYPAGAVRGGVAHGPSLLDAPQLPV
jgi:hypothetical protein